MKKLELDLREVDKEGEDTWADCPAKAELENAILDFAGKVVAVQITEKRSASIKDTLARMPVIDDPIISKALSELEE